MAEKIFNADTQGHTCYDELRTTVGHNNRHNDIARCSCGSLFSWRSEQRDSYWKSITTQEAKKIIKKTNPTLSDEEATELLSNV